LDADQYGEGFVLWEFVAGGEVIFGISQ
jgi:hypothetical protein